MQDISNSIGPELKAVPNSTAWWCIKPITKITSLLVNKGWVDWWVTAHLQIQLAFRCTANQRRQVTFTCYHFLTVFVQEQILMQIPHGLQIATKWQGIWPSLCRLTTDDNLLPTKWTMSAVQASPPFTSEWLADCLWNRRFVVSNSVMMTDEWLLNRNRNGWTIWKIEESHMRALTLVWSAIWKPSLPTKNIWSMHTSPPSSQLGTSRTDILQQISDEAGMDFKPWLLIDYSAF